MAALAFSEALPLARSAHRWTRLKSSVFKHAGPIYWDEMTYKFDDAVRQTVAARCAAFLPLAEETAEALKRAAVAIVISEAGNGTDAALLLTRRAEGLRAHGGQWSLPGGRCDTGETEVEAALRELEEELGVRLEESAVLGLLDGYATRSGYFIRPVVVWARPGIALKINPQEVASVHRVPIDSIAHADALSFISIPQSQRPVIRLRVGNRFIHAPTAAIIFQFLEVLEGRNTRVKDYEQPVFAWK